MRNLYILLITSVFFTLSVHGQDDLPFQVLVAKDANIYGTPVEPLQMIDDVTSIEVKEGGFLSLVHKGGTTYEHTDKIFTFYLKPEELKNRKERPDLATLYLDSTTIDPTKMITILYPPFDRSGYLIWSQAENFDIFWHLHDEPVLNYVISVSDGKGNKIQDFRTRLHTYTLKPNTYGLGDGVFNIKISSTFDGNTVESKTYTVQLKEAETYDQKATDLILKALDLELSPVLALPVWQKALSMSNGEFYKPLFKKFLTRNSATLIENGQDIQQLLSQNK